MGYTEEMSCSLGHVRKREVPVWTLEETEQARAINNPMALWVSLSRVQKQTALIINPSLLHTLPDRGQRKQFDNGHTHAHTCCSLGLEINGRRGGQTEQRR